MKNKYIEISELIKKDIDNNLFTGGKLPTERDMCAKYDVSRSTIREALSVLEKDQIITKRQGSGIFVLPKYSSSKNKIALILKDTDEYIYPNLINLISDMLFSIGYSLVTYSTNGSLLNERKILTDLLSSNIRAVICEPTKSALPNINVDLFKTLKSKNIPTLFILDQYENLIDFPCVMIDSFQSARTVCLSVNERITKTACIFLDNQRSSYQKYLGFFDALHLVSFENIEPSFIFLKNEDIEDLRKGTTSCTLFSFLKGNEDKDIYFCDNDEIAYYIYRNYPFEKNIDILSFDNSYLTKMSHGKIKSHGPSMNELIDSIKNTLLLMLNHPLYSLGDIPCIFLKTTLK
ncbi:MAG: GntR family transcriptional regulator [Lachnospiraceae bacterium]|nr:GntR family transcriptional regulator [Lachnospiraceae bacterium]